MEGVTPEAFKDANFTRDWQETRMLEPSYLYRLTDYTDFVTYTWPNKATEQPVVTVVTDSVRFDEEYKPKQPDGSAYKHEAITSLVVDPTSGAVKGVKNTNNYWIDNPSAYLGKVAGDSEVADQGENYLLKTAGIEVRIPKTPLDIAKKIRTKTQNVLGLHR
jgi:hypothetical protein